MLPQPSIKILTGHLPGIWGISGAQSQPRRHSKVEDSLGYMRLSQEPTATFDRVARETGHPGWWLQQPSLRTQVRGRTTLTRRRFSWLHGAAPRHGYSHIFTHGFYGKALRKRHSSVPTTIAHQAIGTLGPARTGSDELCGYRCYHKTPLCTVVSDRPGMTFYVKGTTRQRPGVGRCSRKA